MAGEIHTMPTRALDLGAPDREDLRAANMGRAPVAQGCQYGITTDPALRHPCPSVAGEGKVGGEGRVHRAPQHCEGRATELRSPISSFYPHIELFCLKMWMLFSRPWKIFSPPRSPS